MLFPTVSGRDLSRRRVTLPQDFGARLNLVMVAFQRWQQRLVDTWIPFARELERSHEDLRAYEIPVIERMNRIARLVIDEGMRAGIPDPVARERTITLYVDKEDFRASLALPNEETIYVLLVDRSGTVLWRDKGAFSAKKGEAVVAALGVE